MTSTIERSGMADERATNERPVTAVAPTFLSLDTVSGPAQVPLYASRPWDEGAPTLRRAVLMLHGRLRNADAYFEMAEKALAVFTAQQTDGEGMQDAVLLLAPQFLADADVQTHGLDARTLHWEWTGWMGGDEARGPIALSAFAVLDAIIEKLADRTLFPALTDVVVAGHSGGAQVVHRYAVLGRGEAALAAHGIATRYVVANPSSYAYFDSLRPDEAGGFAPFDRARCPDFNAWKYGLEALPAYAKTDGVLPNAAVLEAAYARRDVVLLLGQEDNDPTHPALDRSPAAQAQGPHRLARGRAFTRYMQLRHADSATQATFEIPNAAHDADAVFCSPQGLAALFGTRNPHW